MEVARHFFWKKSAEEFDVCSWNIASDDIRCDDVKYITTYLLDAGVVEELGEITIGIWKLDEIVNWYILFL